MKKILRRIDLIKKRFPAFLCICIVFLFAMGCSGEGRKAKMTGSGGIEKQHKYQCADTAMGTIIQQTIYVRSADQNIGKEVSFAVMEQIRDLERNLLSWRLSSSEVYAVNRTSGQERGVRISDSLRDLLGRCLEVSEASGGAFDVTMGSLTHLWNIDEEALKEASAAGLSEKQEIGEGRIPEEEAIHTALESTGYDKVRLDGNLLYLPAGMQLDLGAVGKGAALERIRDCLQEQEEVAGAVISLGGSILTYGEKADGSPWGVAVADPADTGKSLGYFSLRGEWCVSTSGDYERYLEEGGIRYHHIMDPFTGYPVDNGMAGVTVLSKDGFLSDALSTACFVLGPEKGSRLAEKFGAEALFVDHKGNLTMTEGMEEYFHLSKS